MSGAIPWFARETMKPFGPPASRRNMIRVRVATLSGAIDLTVHDRKIALERLPRVYTVRERVGRWARGPKYEIRGLTPDPIAVSYHLLGDRIQLRLPGGPIEVAMRLTKSAPFSMGDQRVRLHVFPLRGRLLLETLEGRKVARGTYGLGGVEFTQYEKPLEPFLAAVAVGFALREEWSEAAWVPLVASFP